MPPRSRWLVPCPRDRSRPLLCRTATGRFLYVANRTGNDISVVDLTSGAEAKRLVAAPGASYLAPVARWQTASTARTYIQARRNSARRPNRRSRSLTPRGRWWHRTALPNVAGVFHVAISADGRLGMAAQLRPKNLIPLAHVEHGWVFGNSLSIFGDDVGEVVQVPIDELDRYFALPFGIAITPDKSPPMFRPRGRTASP